MKTLHTIKARLYDNLLTEDPNDFIARVTTDRSLSIKDIAKSAATRGGADLSATVIEHAVEQWLKEMSYLLCDGLSVNADGYFTVTPHIKGSFNSPNETFDPAKHTISFHFQQGARLRKEQETATVEILGVANTSLNIAQVIDVKTGSINDTLTPNRTLRIKGTKLKIVGDSTPNGVYFINYDTQARTKVDPTDIVLNNPSELIVVIPPLAAGKYQLELCTQYSANKRQLLNEPRVMLFEKLLTVA